MGSIHSGRRDGKPLVEDCLTLDLAWLMRLGPIRDGGAGDGKIEWSIDGIIIASAHFRLDLREIESARLTVMHVLGGVKPSRQEIALTATAQHFGGRRWWMRCPVTSGRVRTLHLAPGSDRFVGRKALGLSYRVERLGRFDRPFEKLFRAQRRLGGVQGLAMGLARPKGMWARTYARHVARFEKHDLCCVKEMAKLIDRS